MRRGPLYSPDRNFEIHSSLAVYGGPLAVQKPLFEPCVERFAMC